MVDDALRRRPADADLLECRARLLAAAGRLEQARRALDALAVRPGARYGVFLLRSAVRLLDGDCAGGWDDLMRAYALCPSFMFSYAEARGASSRRGLSRWMTDDAFDSRALLKELDEAVRRRPRLAAAWAWRGLLRRRMGDYGGCAADLDRARSLGLETAMTLTWRGEARLQTGDAGGLDEMRRAATLDCRAWNHAWLGRAKIAFGRDPGALKCFDEALRLEPDNGWYLAWRAEAKRLLGIRRGLLRDFDRALALDPGYGYASWVRTWRGLACLQLGRPREALRDFDLVLREAPDYALAVVGRARAERALGRIAAWVSDLDRAASLDAKHVQAWYSRPRADVEQNAAVLDRLCRRRPAGAGARRWLGFFQLLLGRLDEARGNLERAARRDAHHSWTWAWLGQTRQLAGEPAAALKDYGRALRSAPDSALILHWRAGARLALGQAQGALRDLEASVRRDGRFAAALGDLGRVRLLLRRPAEAANALRAAVGLDRNDAGAWADLARACSLSGDRKGRDEAERRARALDPSALKNRRRAWATAGR